MRAALIICALVTSSGCRDWTPLWCEIQRDCDRDFPGQDAVCLYDGIYGMYCALADKNCPSGRRWREEAHKSVAGQCVDPAIVAQYDFGRPADLGAGDGR